MNIGDNVMIAVMTKPYYRKVGTVTNVYIDTVNKHEMVTVNQVGYDGGNATFFATSVRLIS